MHVQCLTSYHSSTTIKTPVFEILSKEHTTLQCIALVTLQNLNTLWKHDVCYVNEMQILTWSSANVVLLKAVSACSLLLNGQNR